MFKKKYKSEKNSEGEWINKIKIKILNLDKVYTNKLNKLNKDLQDNKKSLQENIENEVNTMKTFIKKNMDDYYLHAHDDLYKKFEVLSSDFKENLEKTKLDFDAKMQEYFLECELRLKKKYEEIAKK